MAEIDAAVVAGALTRGKRSSCSLAPRPLVAAGPCQPPGADRDLRGCRRGRGRCRARRGGNGRRAQTARKDCTFWRRWPPSVRPIPRRRHGHGCCPGWMTAPSRPAMRRRSSWPWPTARWRCGRSQAPTSRRWSRMGRSTWRRPSRSSTAAVPATLDADIAIVVLAHMAAAGDAALQSAVRLRSMPLIAAATSRSDRHRELQALLPGASTALQAVVDEALAILLTDPATLAETAGLGSPAQVQAAVDAIVLLFTTDPMAAQGILDALSSRIARRRPEPRAGREPAGQDLRPRRRCGDAGPRRHRRAHTSLNPRVDNGERHRHPGGGRRRWCDDGLRGLRCAVAARLGRQRGGRGAHLQRRHHRQPRSTPPSMPASTAHRTPSPCSDRSCPAPRPACVRKRWPKCRPS